MFASLHRALDPNEELLLQQWAQAFPFWSDCQREALEALSPVNRAEQAKQWILDPETGWNHLSKGFIPFHRYPDGEVRTSLEEHAAEWALFAGDAPLHFTVSRLAQKEIDSMRLGKSIATSVQSPSTDTLAWDLEASAVARHEDGSLLFRPGGHGSLLSNLEAIRTPFVLIRNIDNVVPARLMASRNEEQQVLLGRCSALVQERNALLLRTDCGSSGWMKDAMDWLMDFDEAEKGSKTAEEMKLLLDRPIRVAGMVRNQGAQGGGPFWIQETNGRSVPSIVEGSELHSGSLKGGTHFNPVDLVCSMQRADGSWYDLHEFSDDQRYFTGTKDWNGSTIRILERPGLWNGGMDGWLTQFVEVPAMTFAPVKTVFDLLDSIRRF